MIASVSMGPLLGRERKKAGPLPGRGLVSIGLILARYASGELDAAGPFLC